MPQQPSDAAAGDPLRVEPPAISPLLEALAAGNQPDPKLVEAQLNQAFENLHLYLRRLMPALRYLEGKPGVNAEKLRLGSEIKHLLELSLGAAPAAHHEFDVPIRFRRGHGVNNQKAYVDSAVDMISQVAQEMNLEDLSRVRVLDIGCGVKFTQAFYGRKVPVKRYHGVEVDHDMIDFLSTNVNDGRFSYKHINVYNERYNKTGQRLSSAMDIGANGESFDLVCLFSVFTHLNPSDYQEMLALARRYVSRHGTFIFTTFINENIPDFFHDYDPERPLWMALYRESAVREFAEKAGWIVKRIFVRRNQHWIICATNEA